MEKLLKKLKKILAKMGKSDEEIESIVAELESDTTDDVAGNEVDETKVDDKTDKETDGKDDKKDEPTKVDESKGDDDLPAPPVDEPVTPTNEEVPPVIPPEATVPAEAGDPAAAGTDVVPPAPVGVSGPELDEIRQKLEEKEKAITALAARVDSLLEALKTAGIIKGEEVSDIGVNTPDAPANPVTPSGGLDDFLEQVNSGSVR